MTEQERRSEARVEVWIPALLTVLAPDRPELIRQRPVTVVDLSERGAMVAVHEEEAFCAAVLRDGRPCRLSFGPSSGLPEQVVGKPVWGQAAASETRIGLFFESCPSEIRLQLRAYLKGQGASPGPATG